MVTDFENKEIMIPNKAFITERVVNWTLSDQTTRLLIPVGVAYGTDVEQAQRVLLAAVESIADVLREPAPSAFFVGFGDSALDFEIRAFVDAFDKRLRVRHEIHVAVARALADAGIEIPFPQRDLHIRSAEGLEQLAAADRRSRELKATAPSPSRPSSPRAWRGSLPPRSRAWRMATLHFFPPPEQS